ncbi:MAG: polymer-forming cytoskeletal protein [Anaerolineae bacterium]
MNRGTAMHKRILVCVTAVLLGGLLLPTMPAAAASDLPDDGVVIWNEDYTLAEDETLDGDLVVFNGDVTLESGSRISGNVVVWNGSADVDGAIAGNLVISSGQIQLGEDAYVQGDVVCSWNCDIEREDGARVEGDVVEGPSLRGLPFAGWGERGLRVQIPSPEAEPFWLSGPEQVLRWILRIVRSLVTIVVIAAIGGVVALIWPQATAQVGRTAFESPGASLGVGFLTVVAAITLIIALAITICLSPAAVLMALFLGAAGLFGWVAIGARVGERLLDALGAGEVAPLWVAGLGTLVITLITLGLTTALCLAPLGWLLTFVIGCFGLGAVVLTRFGTMAYVPGQRRVAEEPPSQQALVEQPLESTAEDEGAEAEEAEPEGDETQSA